MKRNRKCLTATLTSLIALTAYGIIPAHAQTTAAGQEPLRLVNTFTLPSGITGHFDHLIVDTGGKRIFLTPEDYHKVLVLDADTGKLLHEIAGIEKPHAILYRPEINRIFVTDGADGSLKVFDAKTYQQVGRVALLKDADAIGYDPATNYLYIDNGGGDVGQKYSMLSVVDTNTDQKLADIRIEGDTLEAIELDVNRPRLYVNNREKNQVAVVDRLTNKVMVTWPVTMCKTNVTMAIDEAHHRLFLGCRSSQMVVIDTNTGKELQALPIVKGVDDTVFDSASQRLYFAGDGAISVYEETDANHYRSLGNVPSGPLGKTARLVPSINQYFVAVPQHGTSGASVLVFEPQHVKVAEDAPATPLYKVHAPMAQHLVLATLSANPFLIKLGLHGAQPGHTESVILANGNVSKIGKSTSAADFENIKSGNTWCRKDEQNEIYDIKMPMFDAKNRRIGMLVMEIPTVHAKDQVDAIQQAESIRKEMSAQIPDLAALFQG